MRILQLNANGHLVGGVEQYIVDITRLLESNGHTSHLVYFRDSDTGEPIPNATHAASKDPANYLPETIDNIESVIKQFQPDVAYIHAVYEPGIVRWIQSRLPSVAYVHGPYIVCPGSAHYLRKSQRACPHDAGLICILNAQTEKCCFGRNPIRHVNQLMKVRAFIQTYADIPMLVGSTYMRNLLGSNGLPMKDIFILPPALLPPAIHPFAESPDPGTILFQGRLVPEKGLLSLIQALSAVGGQWRLLVAGEGEELEVCRKTAAALGLADKVKFLGWVSETQMNALYQASSFVVVPSLWPEPYGRTGPEAFFHSRPVIAYASGGIPDWLEDGITGYLVPPGDVLKLRQRIKGLLASPEMQQKMGKAAGKRAKNLWNDAYHHKSLITHFEEARQAWGAKSRVMGLG